MFKENLSKGSFVRLSLFITGIAFFGPLALAITLFWAARESKSTIIFAIQSLSWGLLVSSALEGTTNGSHAMALMIANGVILFWIMGLYTYHSAPRSHKRIALHLSAFNISFFHACYYIVLPIYNKNPGIKEFTFGLLSLIASNLSFYISKKEVKKEDILSFVKQEEMAMIYISFLFAICNILLIISTYEVVIKKYSKAFSSF